MSSTVRMVFILILLIVILAAGLAFWYINQSFKVNAPVQTQTSDVLAIDEKVLKNKKTSYTELGKLTFPTEQILTNLKSGHIVRARFTFLVDEENVVEELTERHFQVSSAVIALLHSKTPDDLSGDEGLKRLQNEIKERVNAFLESGEVVEVYTMETILQ